MARVRAVPGGGTCRLPELTPGEIVWARIINGCENASSRGKVRPVILVARRGSAWRTIGLTTKSRFLDGGTRVAVPDPRGVGLDRPTWVWSGRLVWTAGIDIHDHIGWVDAALAEAVIRAAGLDHSVAGDLHAAAGAHHPSDRDDRRAVAGDPS